MASISALFSPDKLKIGRPIKERFKKKLKKVVSKITLRHTPSSLPPAAPALCAQQSNTLSEITFYDLDGAFNTLILEYPT
ncbi:hypothetical protein ABW20_dc0110425 [Dactylellina cionopaga]|nr:hypothetical protein ABW20_dc0110425 [Dactylellina cionopaga]